MNSEFLKNRDLIPFRSRPTIGAPGEDSSDGQPGQCAEYLLDLLKADSGILGMNFDTGSARLSVQYDAGVLPAERAEEIAEQIGRRLATHQSLCIIRDSAGGCQSCAATLQQGLRQRGETLANVTFTPGRLALAPSASALEPAEVVRPLNPPREPFWRRWDKNRWEIALTVATAVLIAAAWIGGR